MRYIAFLDESGSHDQSATLVVGVLVFRPLLYRAFQTEWRRLLRRAQVPAFHGTDVRGRRKAFRGWTVGQQEAFLRDANDIIQRRAVLGLDVCLDRADFEAQWRPTETVKGIQLDTPYSLCVRHAAAMLPDVLKANTGREDLTIDLVLEDGDKSAGAGDTPRVMRQLQAEIPDVGRHIGGLSFGGKDLAGLQGADAIAFSAWVQEPAADLMDYAPEGGLAGARRETRASCPIFRIQVSPESMMTMRANLEEWTAARRNGRG